MFEKKLLSTLLVFGGILLFLYMVKPLVPGLCLALVLVYLMNPMTDFFQKYVKRRFPATVISLALILVFFGILFYLLVDEILRETLRLLEYPRVREFLEFDVIFLESFSLNSLLQHPLADRGLNMLIRMGYQMGIFLIQVFLGLLLSSFVVWKKVRISVKDEKMNQFLGIVDRGIKHLVRSFFLTSIITGLISIPIYFGFAVPYPLLLAILTAFLALLPILGAYLLYFPLAVGLYFERGLGESALFLAVCAVFIGVFPDILVRPLTARTKEVGAAPMLVGFMGGLLAFGVSGIVLGPVLVIGAVAFWRVYLEEK